MQRQNFEGRVSLEEASMDAGGITQRHWETSALIDHRSKLTQTKNSKFEFENELDSGNFDVCSMIDTAIKLFENFPTMPVVNNNLEVK